MFEPSFVLTFSDRQWNMWIPGFGSEDLRPHKKLAPAEAHRQVILSAKKYLSIFHEDTTGSMYLIRIQIVMKKRQRLRFSAKKKPECCNKWNCMLTQRKETDRKDI